MADITQPQQAAAAADSGYASVPAVQQYLKMAERCAVDCAAQLREAGIDAAVLADNNKRIPGAALERLLARLIPASGDALFGLHTSQFIQPASYSVLGYITMNCANLREALVQVPVYEKIVGDMGVTTTERRGQDMFIRWSCNFSEPLVRRHVIENVLASWLRYARWIAQVEADPIRVCFEHPAPACALDDYRELFRCELLFDQPESGIWFDSALLDQPFQQADAQLLATLLDHASLLLREIDKDQSLVYQVKNRLRLMLQEELPRKETIAAQLGMNSRTLQRRLNEEGSGYQELLNELRLERAIHYLKHSELSLDEIGAKLGFAEPRSFYRSFKQWTGQTAGAYREQLQRGAD